MAPKRTARTELSPFQRGWIIGARKAGCTAAKIAERVGCVSDTVRLAKSRQDGQSKPRSGRPKSLSARDARRRIRIVLREPTITYKRIQEELGIDISRATLRRAIKSEGILHEYVVLDKEEIGRGRGGGRGRGRGRSHAADVKPKKGYPADVKVKKEPGAVVATSPQHAMGGSESTAALASDEPADEKKHTLRNASDELP
ncbi:hypothetical protein LTR50_000834 [Elasticomyces elasticus]|nr:hypothetical protein LTR50_000834 [Elasticomyces elasticus]